MAVAKVSAQGLVTAVGNGVTHITATAGSASGSIEVSVEIRGPSPDREALVALYNATSGPDWTDNTNWLSEKHVEEWYGVNTDRESRVTHLNLGRNGLEGELPVQLAQLARLEGLSLENNKLTGTIPPELGQLAGLRHLYMFDNQFTGFIPTELGMLVNLVHLCLNGNRLTGAIPVELGGLAELKWLHLHFNPDLSGFLPTSFTRLDLDALLLQGTQVCLPGDPDLEHWLDEIENVRVPACDGPKPDLERQVLESLYHATNGPNWKNATNWLTETPVGQWHGVDTNGAGKVIVLELYSNNLSGKIPPELGNLHNLTSLDLGSNRLTGGIPVELGNLTSLSILQLYRNKLTGSIPAELGQLANLRRLDLHENGLTWGIPVELGNLTNLTSLRLESNRLTGGIPVELGSLTALSYLDLGSNQLRGRIPVELGNLTNLTGLRLRSNHLTGGIPVELGNLTALSNLDLYSNQLRGGIPSELSNLTNLTDLSLGANKLTGSIPSELGMLKSLEELSLNQNQLTGSIPSELGQLTQMRHLYLYANQLTGSIPPELGQLTNLRILNLFGNLLSSGIPSELGQLTKLTHLLLYHNPSLTGTLPPELARLRALESLILVYTQVCVPSTPVFEAWLESIEEKHFIWCERPVVDRELLVKLYESTNGPNWSDKTNWLSSESLGNWFGVGTNAMGRVEQLNLEANNLSGRLPGELGRLADLTDLNLSGNPSLSGPLPRGHLSLSLRTLRLDGTQLCLPVDAEFQTWLMSISQHSGVSECGYTVETDRDALIEFYHATGGPDWNDNTNWLSDAPLGDWYGVYAHNNAGQVTGLERVTGLDLPRNNLSGSLPSELGNLTKLNSLVLIDNNLTGSIPPELGQLADLEILNLASNRLTGTVPAELGALAGLWNLNLSLNRLTGAIPPELGNLVHLSNLDLEKNQLSGSIPPELGKLTNLRVLNLFRNLLTGPIPAELSQINNPKLELFDLGGNGLTGGIPPELGKLTHLRWRLDLGVNQLTGPIPAELGNLTRATELILQGNKLSGTIPSDLGEIAGLKALWLNANLLSGSIPAELGQLTELVDLSLEGNNLTGCIPPELGQLANVEKVALWKNELTGTLPSELGNLTNLKFLNVSDNIGLAGPIPLSMTGLDLRSFILGGTQICAPADPDFQAWFQGVGGNSEAVLCQPVAKPEVVVYLTQAVQSPSRPVPLVEEEPALLRVFMATQEVVSNNPAVRVTFYRDGNEVHSVALPAGPSKIPRQIDESSLESSGNALVPAEVVRPDLEMVVEIDIDGTLDPDSGIDMRIPETGRMAVDVRPVPPLDLTLVPLLWMENPDHTVVTQTEGLMADDDLFRWTRDLLPVKEFDVSVREPLYTSVEPVEINNERVLNEVMAVRLMDGARGHYMGIWNAERAGIAAIKGRDSVSLLDGKIMAHELGHNMGLFHAPCGGPLQVDVAYPNTNGNIGVWGYDLLSGELIDPSTPDIMGYCFENPWIGDFHYRNAFRYRYSEELAPVAAASGPRERSLLLWGGADGNGEVVLEPTFVVDAPPSLPRGSGPYGLVGEDVEGNSLFRLSFAMNEIADGDGGSGFAFMIPVQSGWSTRLARITLAGPEGSAEMTRDSNRPAALMLDQATGIVRGILRDWPELEISAGSARRVLPEPGLEVMVSPGIPDPLDW